MAEPDETVMAKAPGVAVFDAAAAVEDVNTELS